LAVLGHPESQQRGQKKNVDLFYHGVSPLDDAQAHLSHLMNTLVNIVRQSLYSGRRT
jgi:hypothetical protein